MILFKENLGHGFLNGGEIEVGFRHDVRGGGVVHIAHILAEDVVPDALLDVKVDKVTLKKKTKKILIA